MKSLDPRSIRTGQTEVSCKMPLLKMTYSGQPIGMSHPFSDHKRELQCVTSSECSEHCSHLIPLHVALGADFLSLFLYSGYGPAVEERRMESDGKIRTTTSPIS
ncbi:unnamed protein product [Leuciscus chuanchicus]